MAKFVYKAVDNQGKEQSGVVEAEDEHDALGKIGVGGLFVTDMHPASMVDEISIHWQERRDQRRAEESRVEERERAKRPRLRLAVRFADGETIQGSCFALDPREHGFHLEIVDEQGKTTGETRQVRFSDLKAVFHIKSFDGHFHKSQFPLSEVEPAHERVIEFRDGEVFRGYCRRPLDVESTRFFININEPDSNNIAALIEKSAVQAIYTPEEYRDKLERQREEWKRKGAASGLSQEETMGDFYFETRDYSTALAYYKAATRIDTRSTRLVKKQLATEYNIGVQHIKRREYAQALEYMEKVLKVDPSNPQALKNAQKLRKIVEREQEKRGGASKPPFP